MKSIVVTLATIAFVLSLSACQTRPKMTTIESGDEKPINTPEAALELKTKFEK